MKELIEKLRQAAKESFVYSDILKEAADTIEEMMAEREEGKWIWDDDGFHCADCDFHAYDNSIEIMQGIWKYCPHCGERMDGKT